MPYTADEQKIYDFIRNSLPRFLFAQDNLEEIFGAIVKAFDQVRQETEALFDASLITSATAGPPDYLGQHAIDRGTFRQDAENDAALRDRLRTIDDVVSRPALIAAAESVLAAESIVGDVHIVEIRHGRIYFVLRSHQGGDSGGIFSGTPPDMLFKPPTGETFTRGRYSPTTISRKAQRLVNPTGFADTKLVISGANNAGNDGTFDVTGVDGDYVTYTNASGVVEVDGVCTWEQKATDYQGNVIDGWRAGYLSRGYRMGNNFTIVVILPYGSTASTEAAVIERMRQACGAGIDVVVERRLIP
jgi:hypothetical protein